MLSARVTQLRAAGTSTIRRAAGIARVNQRTMAQLTVYVKGDPAANKLLDCPFCHRVLLTLEGKRIPYTKEYIDFNNKPQWLVDQAEGKVPVIKDGDMLLPDSDKIVEYLEAKFPEPAFKSAVPAEIAANKVFPSFVQLLKSTDADRAEKEAALLEQLQLINGHLASKGPFFGGAKLDATDASMAPKLYHMVTALKHFKSWELPASVPAVQTYVAAIKATPEFQATDYGTDAIIGGWNRHLGH